MANSDRVDHERTDRAAANTRVYTTTDPNAKVRSGEPTLGQLVTDITEDFSALVRQEIKLARVETMETVSRATRGGVLMAAGGMVAYAGLILVLIGLAFLLGQVLESFWLAALIVGVVVLIVGAILLSSGRSKLKDLSLAPEKTIQTLKDDARFVKEKVS